MCIRDRYRTAASPREYSSPRVPSRGVERGERLTWTGRQRSARLPRRPEPAQHATAPREPVRFARRGRGRDPAYRSGETYAGCDASLELLHRQLDGFGALLGRGLHLLLLFGREVDADDARVFVVGPV